MSQISRTYSFSDPVPLAPYQVESEIFNIVNTWNNTDRGILGWNNVNVAYGGAGVKFTSQSGLLNSYVRYTTNQFCIDGDSTGGVRIPLVSIGNNFSPSYGGLADGICVTNASSGEPTSDPTDSCLLWATNGALRFRGSNGALLTIAPAGMKAVSYSDTPYSVASADVYIAVDATSGAVTVTLPLAASNEARMIHIKKIDVSANAVTVARASSDDIEGATSYALSAQFDSVTLYAGNSVRWFILSST